MLLYYYINEGFCQTGSIHYDLDLLIINLNVGLDKLLQPVVIREVYRQKKILEFLTWKDFFLA